MKKLADRLIQNEVLPFEPVTMAVEPGLRVSTDTQ